MGVIFKGLSPSRLLYNKYDPLSHFKSSSVQQLKDRERISMETNKRAQ